MIQATIIQQFDCLVEKMRSLSFVLPLAQRQVLLILSHEKAANLSQLAKLRNVRKSSMSVMMSQLLEQQLVVKGFAKSDRRQRYYMLSRLGKEILERDLQYYHEWLTQALEPLSVEQQRQLGQTLELINNHTHDPITHRY